MPKKIAKNPSLRWEAYEYEHYNKSFQWFLSVIIISLAVFVAAVIVGNFLFGALVAVSGTAIALFGVRKPRIIDFALTPRGAQVGDKLFLYGDLDSFWIHYDPPGVKTISIKSKKTFMPYIQMPLGNADPAAAREILIEFLNEKEHKEPFSDILMRLLKF